MEPRACVSVLVYALDPLRILLLRRPAHRAAGWQSVSGRVEAEDGPADSPQALRAACLREVQEETGLGAPLELVDLGHESRFTGYDGVAYWQRHYGARYADATPPDTTPEHEEARWVVADEAMRLLTWDADRKALGTLRAHHAATPSPER